MKKNKNQQQQSKNIQMIQILMSVTRLVNLMSVSEIESISVFGLIVHDPLIQMTNDLSREKFNLVLIKFVNSLLLVFLFSDSNSTSL